MLIAVGLIIFMAVFIKVCSVHTPSSNPRKPPALKFSETLRRPIKKVSYHFFYSIYLLAVYFDRFIFFLYRILTLSCQQVPRSKFFETNEIEKNTSETINIQIGFHSNKL
jgi:hypothetical protein